MKFFDVLDHREVLKAYDAFAAECPGVDPCARRVVEVYLASYNFEGSLARAALSREQEKFCRHVDRIPKEVLERIHGREDSVRAHLGLPQGGVLSR